MLSECGFTIGSKSYGANDVITRALNAANDIGVKFAVESVKLSKDKETCEAFVNEFKKNNKNLGIWMLADGSENLQLQHLSDIAKVIQINDSNHMVYLNFRIDSKVNYSKYLDHIQELLAPSVCRFFNY